MIIAEAMRVTVTVRVTFSARTAVATGLNKPVNCWLGCRLTIEQMTGQLRSADNIEIN